MEDNFSWLKKSVLQTGNKTLLAVNMSIHALLENNTAIAAEVRDVERQVDAMYYNINEYCLATLASRQFSRNEVNLITCSLKIAMELERICDYANQISKLVQKKLSKQDTAVLANMSTMVSNMGEQTLKMLQQALNCYESNDSCSAMIVIDSDSVVDKMNKDLFREMLCLVSINLWAQEAIMDYHVAVRYIERVADRTTNISELVYYIVQGESHKKLSCSEEIWQ